LQQQEELDRFLFDGSQSSLRKESELSENEEADREHKREQKTSNTDKISETTPREKVHSNTFD